MTLGSFCSANNHRPFSTEEIDNHFAGVVYLKNPVSVLSFLFLGFSRISVMSHLTPFLFGRSRIPG